MTDEPRFLRSEGGADEQSPASNDAGQRVSAESADAGHAAPESSPTPEQRAVIEAVLAGRIDEVAPRGCIGCDSLECAPVYVLLDHSAVEVGRRYSIFGAISIQSSRLVPCVMPMCAACWARIAANRRHRRVGAWVAGIGLVVAMGYFVAALTRSSTPVALVLLFGGGGVAALGMVYAVLMDRSLHKHLRLSKVLQPTVLVVSKDRKELDRSLERCKLSSLELQNEIDRKANEALALPAARINVK
ncbi:MAG TPA: hypothetical protein VIV11_30535 [Kofleriaceae bacterium]